MSGYASVGPDTLEADLLALYKFTTYAVTVAAFTAAVGQRSGIIYARTSEDSEYFPILDLESFFPVFVLGYSLWEWPVAPIHGATT